MQNHSNHHKYYAPHHFIPLPLLLAAIIFTAYSLFQYPEHHFIYASITVALLLLAFSSIMMRQHYALGNQDRIIRLEMRLRYYQLTNQRFEQFEKQLSLKQIAALRFAGDEELQALLQRTLAEGLTAAQIKKAITNWQADDMRV